MEEKDITLSVAEKMLSYVDSTDREIWYKMAAALKNHFGEDGRGLYHKWSAKAKNYNERAADSQFNSARYGSNNIWFLYNRAKERGWQPDKTYQPTAAEIEQQQQKLAQAEKKRQKEERERAKKQANASRRAKYVFEERTKQADPKHPYLVKKGISDPAVLQHIRQSGNNLIIPLKQGKKVVGMEMIFPNGGKHFPADTPKKGSALFLGDTRLENIKQGFFVAEGFATAASIVQATGRPCLMTIDAGNMPTVAKTLKPLIDKYQMPVWVAADINDGSVKNPNVGLQHAQEVVEILGETVRIITPDFTDNEVQQWKITHDNEPPTDFNDLQAIGGIERVRSVLATAFSEPEPVVNIQNPEQKLLINVYGSPATGKSYTAEHLAAALRDAGIECELVTEYATELIHQGRTDELKDQVVVTGEQLRREQAALNHANIVITDSPTALGIIYAPEYQKAALHDIAAQSDKIPHINILLRHDYESLATFSMNGRIHDKEQSLAIQEQLIELLKGKERIHHQRATPFEELINHIGTNQEWQRFAEHHNINLPRFDIAMDGTVLGKMGAIENDTLTVSEQTLPKADIQSPSGEKALNPDDEKPRLPQGGIFLPENSFRQPEQINPKENLMATDDKKLLMDMLDSSNTELRKNAALNEMADDEVLRKAYQDKDESVRLAAVRNPNASSEFLQDAFNDAFLNEKEAILNHPNANEELFKEALVYSSDDSVINTAREHLQNKYGWDDERFAALEQERFNNLSRYEQQRLQEEQSGLKKSELTAAPPLEKQEWQPDTFTPDTWQSETAPMTEQNKHLDSETAQKVDETTTQAVDNTEKDLSGSPEQSAKPQIDKDFAERQAELNRQKAEWQNKLDEMYRQKEAMDNLQVQLTQEQLDEIDKKFEEIYAKQAELDRQTDELQIERRQVLGQADISENLNEENSIYFGESDEIITAEEINKPQAVFATPKEKANAVFEELKTHYQGYGEYNSKDSVMYLPNGKNAEMLHFDPTQERIVLSAVNPQTKGREEIADTHFSNLDPHYIALAVDKDYQQYQQTIAQNQGKFPDNEQKKTIDKAGDSVEETIRTAKSKTAKLTPPEAPPQGLTERYNAVERKFLDSKTNLRLTHRVDYVDSENGKTVLFTDKGSKLTTAKNDPQTAADMVEVAKAKGWTTLKLSGNKEFKRQAWLAAESQGIKTKGYKPSPQDLAMLEKMREKRSLNSVEQTKKQEQTPKAEQQQQTKQAETAQKEVSGSPKQESTPETAIQGGILLEHGAARFQFDKDKPMSYYAMLQMPNGEKQVLWGKEIEKTLQEHNVQIGDRISLQKNGYESVRVQEPVKDKDGKTVLDENGNPKMEEVMRKRNHWDLAILDKAQEVPKEQEKQEVKHDLMGQSERYGQENNHRELANSAKLRTRAIANADKISSLSAGLSEDGLVPTEVKTKADKLESAGNRVLANTTNHTKIQSTQIQKGSMPNGISVKARLTQARQTFKNKMSSLPDDERRKVLAYEKGAMDIWEKVADKDTQERLQVNFYTSISEKIQDGKTTLPPAMSNAAAKEALENRRTEREREMAMER